MSAGRGRRRRRRRPGRPAAAAGEPSQAQEPPEASTETGGSRRRRRRRRGATKGARPQSPRTLEDVIRSIKGSPESLAAEPDGQKLEDVIGELQSIWGVPQYPQEYRLMIKVAENGGRGNGGPSKAPPAGVTRERAPAAPRVGAAAAGEGATREKAPRRRRRSRRGRRGRGSGGASS